MKTISIFCLIALAAFSIPQIARAEENKEAAKLAREAAAAAKDQDFDKAVESARKAAAMDNKYASSLAAALQQRGFAAANERRFPDAIADFGEALKINPRDAGIYERRAAVEMKINDFDKALADYNEAIKIKPNDARIYNYRGYIFEMKGDLKNAMADTEKVLKMERKNAEALARRARLETRLKQQAGMNAPPPAAPAPPPKKP
jgi:tetratricopeptide (TPR) repeat protein